MLNETLKDVRDEPTGSRAGAAVLPPRASAPAPPVDSTPAAGTTDKPRAALAAPEGDLAGRRRRRAILVAVATSIVLLAAAGVAVWYFTRDSGQLRATINQSTAPASSPSVITTPSGSASETSTAEEPTGSDIGYAVETDVRWTSDNRAVIIHDEAATQGLRCDRPCRVSQTTWKVLSEHCRSFTKNGKSYPPTTYANLMAGLAGYDSWVYVEVKDDQNAAKTGSSSMLSAATD